MDITVTVDGKEYSIIAVAVDESKYQLGVCEVAADGGVGLVIIDPETTDEEYDSAETCILHGVAMVI